MWQSIKDRIRPNRKKIYIVPTRVGAFFIFVTLVMLLVGSGYSNNLVNVLAFFMFALIFVAMVLTHLQVKGLEVGEVEVFPTFAGESGEVAAAVHNPQREERWGIELALRPTRILARSFPTHVPAEQTAQLRWSLPPQPRGRYSLDKIELLSVFPLGLFHAWKVLPIRATCIVYPRRVGDLPLPSQRQGGEGEVQQPSPSHTGDDFRGHRKYLVGDSPRQIDWKAHARGRPLLIKEINDGEPPEQILDWHTLGGLDDEARLSQLAVWVWECGSRGGPFRLRLPAQAELAGRGWEHATRCLEALAVYGLEPTDGREPTRGRESAGAREPIGARAVAQGARDSARNPGGPRP